MAQANDDEKNRAGDHKSDTCEGEWRQISETQFDEQPCRSPDAAKYQPNDTRFHLPRIFAERRGLEKLFAFKTKSAAPSKLKAAQSVFL